MKTNLFLFAVLGTLVLGACAKKTDNGPSGSSTTTYADTYTITGPGFSNAVYSMTSVSASSSTLVGTDTTTIVVSGSFGDSVSLLFNVQLIGSTATTYQLGDPSTGAPTSMAVTTIQNKTSNQTIYNSQPGSTLTITSYGGVGSPVTGTFKGKFQSAVGNSYTITNGAFSATRVH